MNASIWYDGDDVDVDADDCTFSDILLINNTRTRIKNDAQILKQNDDQIEPKLMMMRRCKLNRKPKPTTDRQNWRAFGSPMWSLTPKIRRVCKMFYCDSDLYMITKSESD